MHTKHGVVGVPDPNFKPNPNEKHVYDEKKGVYRKVVVKPKPKEKQE